jgi:hypothetical protein
VFENLWRMAVAEFGSTTRVFSMGEIGTDENFGHSIDRFIETSGNICFFVALYKENMTS